MKNYKPILIIVLVGLGTILHISGLGQRIVSSSGWQDILHQDHAYLHDSTHHAEEIFFALSAAKAGVALVRSIDAGVAFGAQFDLRLGELINAIAKLIDWAWQGMLISLLVFAGMEVLLKVAQTLGHPLWSAFWIVALIYALLNCVFPAGTTGRQVVKRVAALLLIVALMVSVILPVSIYGVSLFSERLTGPITRESSHQIQATTQRWTPDSSDDSKHHHDWAKKTLHKMHHHAAGHIAHLTHDVRHLLIGYLFELIIFPFGVLMFFQMLLNRLFLKSPGR